VSLAWLVTQAERKLPSAGRAAGRRLLVSTNSGHVFVADPVAAVVRKGQPASPLLVAAFWAERKPALNRLRPVEQLSDVGRC
jgi:hypothetical protein